VTAKFLCFRQDLPRFEFIPGVIGHLFLYPARFAKILVIFSMIGYLNSSDKLAKICVYPA
jgi:hypothetical protein